MAVCPGSTSTRPIEFAGDEPSVPPQDGVGKAAVATSPRALLRSPSVARSASESLAPLVTNFFGDANLVAIGKVLQSTILDIFAFGWDRSAYRLPAPELQTVGATHAATTKPPAFDMILVHSFSRFFCEQFQLEFYVRRLSSAFLWDHAGHSHICVVLSLSSSGGH